LRTIKKPDPPAGPAREIRDMNPSYDCVPTRSAAEFWDLMAHMRRKTRDVTAPVLMIYSRSDSDVPYINKWLMGRALGSNLADQMTLDSSPHLMTLGPDAPRVIKRVVSFFSRY
jgi:esterase/lipase